MSEEAFKNHVTSASFSLTLSKAMVETLSLLDQSEAKQGVGLCKFMTYWGLKDRGLVEPVGDIDRAQHWCLVRLTETGRLVIPLLKAAGLYKVQYKGPPPEPIPEGPLVQLKKKPTDAS